MEHAILRAAVSFAAGLALTACAAPAAEELPTLLPQPRETVWKSGSYRLPERVRIGYDSPGLAATAGYLAEALAPYATATTAEGEGDITLSTDTASLAEEAYRLSVSRPGIRSTAGSPRGAANGIATLRQLLPPGAVREAEIPCTEIADEPAFGWRGAMLDVSRHFFDKEEILGLLDQMARLKLNKFHWHLTDDQGWRIEIRRYPDLTGKGAWRHFNKQDTICTGRARRELNDDFLLPEKRLRTEGADTLYGGCYTQRDIREIVSYAAARGIDVIPEIDMPGHFLQAIEHYPWLTCFRPETWSEQAFSSPLCLGRDDVLRFCEEIWEEVFELFPYEYVHIGGDEVNMKNWNRCPRCRARMRAEGLADGHALQAWFTRRMQRFFTEHGRRMIGWDELLADEVDPATTIMWWRPWEPQSVSDATRRGCDVIVSAQSWFYFSLEEDAGSLARTAGFEIRPDSLSDEQQARIKGIQGHLWTEKVPSWSRAEYMLYPRVFAVAEIAWSAPELKDYEDFRRRALMRIDAVRAKGDNSYDLAGSVRGERPESLEEVRHLAVGCPVTYASEWYEGYPADGPGSLTDGKLGSWTYGYRWLGFLNTDVEATVDLGAVKPIREVKADFLQWRSAFIGLPKRVEIAVSTDGERFTVRGGEENDLPFDDPKLQCRAFGWTGEAEARYVRCHAFSHGHPGGWLFIDEIIVN